MIVTKYWEFARDLIIATLYIYGSAIFVKVFN